VARPVKSFILPLGCSEESKRRSLSFRRRNFHLLLTKPSLPKLLTSVGFFACLLFFGNSFDSPMMQSLGQYLTGLCIVFFFTLKFLSGGQWSFRPVFFGLSSACLRPPMFCPPVPPPIQPSPESLPFHFWSVQNLNSRTGMLSFDFFCIFPIETCVARSSARIAHRDNSAADVITPVCPKRHSYISSTARLVPLWLDS